MARPGVVADVPLPELFEPVVPDPELEPDESEGLVVGDAGEVVVCACAAKLNAARMATAAAFFRGVMLFPFMV